MILADFECYGNINIAVVKHKLLVSQMKNETKILPHMYLKSPGSFLRY